MNETGTYWKPLSRKRSTIISDYISRSCPHIWTQYMHPHTDRVHSISLEHFLSFHLFNALFFRFAFNAALLVDCDKTIIDARSTEINLNVVRIFIRIVASLRRAFRKLNYYLNKNQNSQQFAYVIIIMRNVESESSK